MIDKWDWLSEQSEEYPCVNNSLYLLWVINKDLQKTIDITNNEGKLKLIVWWLIYGVVEYPNYTVTISNDDLLDVFRSDSAELSALETYIIETRPDIRALMLDSNTSDFNTTIVRDWMKFHFIDGHPGFFLEFFHLLDEDFVDAINIHHFTFVDNILFDGSTFMGNYYSSYLMNYPANKINNKLWLNEDEFKLIAKNVQIKTGGGTLSLPYFFVWYWNRFIGSALLTSIEVLHKESFFGSVMRRIACDLQNNTNLIYSMILMLKSEDYDFSIDTSLVNIIDEELRKSSANGLNIKLVELLFVNIFGMDAFIDEEKSKEILCWWFLVGVNEYRHISLQIKKEAVLSIFERNEDGLNSLQQNIIAIRRDIQMAINDKDKPLDFDVWYEDFFEKEYHCTILELLRVIGDPQQFKSVLNVDQDGFIKNYIVNYNSQYIGTSRELESFEINNAEVERDTHSSLDNDSKGINLVGYAKAELGIGEDVRMTSKALQVAGVSVGVYDTSRNLISRKNDTSLNAIISSDLRYSLSIICCTAIEHMQLLLNYGKEFFDKRYVIGYWPWELPRWPKEWMLAFKLVDEVWVSSRYIEQSIKDASAIPVNRMPLVVDYDEYPQYKRSMYDLPDSKYMFLFIFDGLSHMERKNPLAHIDAFQMAFDDDATILVIKTMNLAHTDKDLWRNLVERVDADARIYLINETFDKDKLLGLYSCCDAYISLHRAEGFGRTIAEAMLAGKPVIVSKFSGCMDFVSEDTAYLVDGEIIYLNTGDYDYDEGQYWYDPSVIHASEQLKKCRFDNERTKIISKNAQEKIKKSLSSDSLAKVYKSRLCQIEDKNPCLNAIKCE